MTGVGKRTELLSHHEAINVALLDINKLQEIAQLHRVMIPKSLLANLKRHFTGLGVEHRALLRHLERYNIANRKLAQQVQTCRSQRILCMQKQGQRVLNESIESTTILESQVREVQDRVVENNKDIHRLKQEICSTREKRSTYSRMFERSVDKFNVLMEQNTKRRERETNATLRLKDISSCSDRLMTDLENLRLDLEEEQLEHEQRVIDYETGRCELSNQLSATTERNMQLLKSLHKVASEAVDLRDRAEGKREEVTRLERSIAEIATAISLLRSQRNREVEALSRLQEENKYVLEKTQFMKDENDKMERQLLEVTEKLDDEIYSIETEKNIKEEVKIILHDKLVEVDLLEGAETKRLDEWKDNFNSKRDKLQKQSNKVEDMKRAIANRNLQLNHCKELISSSERVQEEHLSKLSSERVRVQGDSENAVNIIGSIRDETTSIRNAHTAFLSETLETETALTTKLAALNEKGKELEEKVRIETERKQKLREACSKLQDYYHATKCLHCDTMEAHAIRDRVLKDQTEQTSTCLQSLCLQEDMLVPVLQDAKDELKAVTTRREDIEETKNKLLFKVEYCTGENKSLQETCTLRQKELGRLRRSDREWSHLEAHYMMLVEQQVLQLKRQQSRINAANDELKVALKKLDETFEKIDRLRRTAPEQYDRLRTGCSQLQRLALTQCDTYQQLASEIRDTEQQTAMEVTQFEKRLRHEEEKLTALETTLRDMLLKLEVFFEGVEYSLQND